MPDFSSWTPKDIALLGAALSSTYQDVQETKGAIKKGAEETNPLYPTTHPSGAMLDTGGLIAAGLAAATAHAIPEKYRGAFLGGWTGLEGGLAYGNSQLKGKLKPGQTERSVNESALPAAALGALAGYALPSGSGDSTVTPTILPNGGQGAFGISYARKF